MKKILLAAMTVLAITACSQNEEFDNVVNQNKEMKFNTAVMKSTRATAITNTDFNTFTLYAYSGTSTIINGTVFSKTTDWAAAGNTKFYWPGDAAVNFYGYSVKDGTATYTSTAADIAPTLAYTPETASASQKDLLVASLTNQTYKAPGSVELSFKHILTKMAFKVQGKEGDATYKITSGKISANGTGTYDFGTNKWTATSPAEYTMPVSNGAISQTDTYMLIPQTGATIELKYSYNVAGQDIDVTKTLNFAEWTIGANLLYTITLDGANQMIITGTATEWTAEGPGTATE